MADLTIVNFITYETSTGKVLSSGTCPRDYIPDQADTGQTALEVSVDVDPNIHYYPSGVKTNRPVVTLAASYTFGYGNIAQDIAVPNPTIVEFQGVNTTVTDGTATFIVLNPGTYEARFTFPFPYQSPATTSMIVT